MGSFYCLTKSELASLRTADFKEKSRFSGGELLWEKAILLISNALCKPGLTGAVFIHIIEEAKRQSTHEIHCCNVK